MLAVEVHATAGSLAIAATFEVGVAAGEVRVAVVAAGVDAEQHSWCTSLEAELLGGVFCSWRSV